MNQKNDIRVFNLEANDFFSEKIPLHGLLQYLYGNDNITLSLLKSLLCRNPVVSHLVGLWMKMPWTKRSIQSFIKSHEIKAEDFEISNVNNFNDFFIRKLKQNARPISNNDIICPCDGRHLFYQDLSDKNSFYIKGNYFSLDKLLGSKEKAALFQDGAMIISRLAPKDYHRFHVPVNAKLNKISLINGPLYSVNPIALQKNISILTQNKRQLLEFSSQKFGNFIQIAIGATNVGSILITAKENNQYNKGDEIGYFSFGGSMVITIFKKNSVFFKEILKNHTNNQTETLINMGNEITDP